MEKIKKIEQEKPPIVDIEINEATLKRWEDIGLGNEILDLIDNFEKIVPPDGKFILSADNFPSTKEFIDDAYRDFIKPGGRNWGDKLDEVRNHLRKVILNFTFKDLDFDQVKPIIIREETKKKEDKEIIKKYFAINRPGLVLVSNGVDWWIERKE